MNILLDTNIVLDLVLERHPFYNEAAIIFSLIEENSLEGSIVATTIITIHYISRKHYSKEETAEIIKLLISLLSIAVVDREVIRNALNSDFSDFEDSIIDQAASAYGIDIIITRNKKDFINSKNVIYTPKEFIAFIKTQ